MKKIFLFIELAIISSSVFAQWLPLEPFNSISYYNINGNYKQTLYLDNQFITIRSNGLERIDFNNDSISYIFKNHYPLSYIVKDTGNNYVFLKNDRYIGRFNENIGLFENVFPDSIIGSNLRDIAISNSGTLWTVTSGTYPRVICNFGTEWQIETFPSYLYPGFNRIITKNDSIVYLMNGNNMVFSFSNGQFDTIYTIPSPGIFHDWDIDALGNLWIAANNCLIKYNSDTVLTFNQSNTPIGTDIFNTVRIGHDGLVWTVKGNNKLMKYDGSSWVVMTLPFVYGQILSFALNNLGEPIVSTNVSNGSIYKFGSGTWTTKPFVFFPFTNVCAMGTNVNNDRLSVANDDGYFELAMPGLYSLTFYDTSQRAFADEIRCFSVNENQYYASYGTTHGVVLYNNTFNNNMLQNKIINSLYSNNGSYYVGTDSGLVVYNGIFYNSINTSNSPLPSNKITFLKVFDDWSGGNLQQILYVGTDKGMAVLKNAQWTVFDTTNIPVNSFYVTGIDIGPMDTGFYVSTMGSGLLHISLAGNYEIYNSQIGNLDDDSLYFVKRLHLYLGPVISLVGTKHHSVATIDDFGNCYYYRNDPYTMDSLYEASIIAYNGLYSSIAYLKIDDKLYIISFGGNNEMVNMDNGFSCYQKSNDEIVIQFSDRISDEKLIVLTDVMGKTIFNEEVKFINGKGIIIKGSICPGVYLINAIKGNYASATKIILN